ncbi:Fic family protein [Luteipulveratus sp. YIM 133132]|uniref:Fic family protein n=1 Tax=Luteipulveratus flavus TaxID=3031728 RepID=UPI0023AF3B2E|nr:Fic family protein [Luteipulveratus sp. YIM 133132]MDE9367531.1 Fic family protein [Luteipulveratus sp. YIM 133132]
MAHWERVRIDPDFTGVSSRERRGGSYLRYHPDPLVSGLQLLSTDALEYAFDSSSAVAVLGERLRARPLPLLYAALIRSESIASSWVEGERETPRNIMLARLDHDRATPQGRSVARNIDAMSAAIARLDGIWQHEDIHQIHATLLPSLSTGGYRHEQVFIGGRSALSAQYVPPPFQTVPSCMDDFLAYVNRGGDNPLLTAVLAHAQFETIHPYTDGNGRVGRALFHGVLHRAGVVTGGVLPLSLALAKDTSAYVDALTAYRHDGDRIEDRRAAVSRYTETMLDFVNVSVAITHDVAERVDRVWDDWTGAVSRFRADSSVHRAVDILIQQPVVTTSYLQRELGVTKMAAHTCVNALVEAGVLTPSGGTLKRAHLYQADAVLDILQLSGSGANPSTP